mgnify:FL=1
MRSSLLLRPFTVALVLLAISHPSYAEDDITIPHFIEETAASGIDSIYEGEWEFMVGGGVATFDCNADGFPDALLAGGASPARFFRNVSAQGGPLRFVAQESGLELEAVSGAYPLDIDSDGNRDVVLLRVGENVLMRGLGGCRFERANEAWGFDGGDAWSTAFAATWERGAAFPTLAIGNYIDRAQEAFPWGSCTDNWLHRPASDGEPRFAEPLPLRPSYCALSMLFTDWNRSSTPDLRVSNDREYYKGGQEQLWRIPPDEAPVLYGEKDGWKRLLIWGMGIASYDLDFDGYPEYFLTSMADNKLQTLASVDAGKPQPVYADIAFAKGATAHRPYIGDDVKPSTAWHTQFEDVDNDGLVDLFIAKGNVAEMPDFAAEDPNNLLLQQADGRFKEVGDKAGMGSTAISRGAALADFNLDGQLDLLVVNRWKPAQLWRNEGTEGNWGGLELRKAGPNREAIGSWIETRRGDKIMRREISVGGGHASGHLGWWHLGLGADRQAELRVVWPDGEAGAWQRVESGRFHIIERGRPTVVWNPS